MAWFKKSPDPISDRARALNAQISALESQIKELNAKLQQNGSHPRLRSTAMPDGQIVAPQSNPAQAEPVFEDIDPQRVKAETPLEVSPGHYNDLGLRKYDLVSAWRRLVSHFRAPATSNPKLVNYLAAGSIQGLRPLRYEKRVARRRFVFLFIFFLLILYGIITGLLHR